MMGLVFISYRSVTSSRTLTLHKYNADWFMNGVSTRMIRIRAKS